MQLEWHKYDDLFHLFQPRHWHSSYSSSNMQDSINNDNGNNNNNNVNKNLSL